nr:immunoglobulin heavy chain junction region [Mus musculus]
CARGLDYGRYAMDYW